MKQKNGKVENINLPSDYSETITDLVNVIEQKLKATLRIVNRAKIELYWEIGDIIVKKQEDSKWGEEVIKYLALDLQSRFRGMKGFSPRNLWRIQSFYLEYQENESLLKLAKEVSWTHNYILLENVKNKQEREFYLRMCIRERWPYRELQKQIQSSLFERFAVAEEADKVLATIPKKEGHFADYFKDEYLFDFLQLEAGYTERSLCKALTNQMRSFLRELGRGFMFGGDEYTLKVGGEEFRIDMLELMVIDPNAILRECKQVNG